MRKIAVVESDTLSQVQKQNLIVGEIIPWVNGRYINEILLEIARKVKDENVVKSIEDELKKSAGIVESLKLEYLTQGGKQRLFETPDTAKVQILEREILGRAENEYVLTLRSRAATAAGNKELGARAAEDLAKVMGYLDGLKKELKRVRNRVESSSK